MAAEAADGDRAAPDQRAGRHHQLHHLRPRPAAACVRCRQGARQSHGAPRARRRDACSRSTARPMRSTTRCASSPTRRASKSLAGIMGGEETGCSAATTDVLIESALWEPLNIAQTGRKLGINSDARYRFERGVDPAFMLPGLELATQMVLDLCGGTPSEITVAGDGRRRPSASSIFRSPRCKRLAGLDVPLPEVRARARASSASSSPARARRVKVAVPSWRADVHGKADIVEEVVRIVGVDRVPSTPFERGDAPRKPVLTADPGAHPQGQARARRARPGRGGDLVVHRQAAGRTVRRRQAGARARQSDRGRSLRHAAEPHSGARRRRAEECRPRLSRRGAVRGRAGFPRRPAGGSAHRRGRRAPRAGARPSGIGRHWSKRDGEVDAFDAKADALAVLAAAGAPPQALQVVPGGPAWFHPGRSRHDPDRPAERARPFRRIASARARGARRRRSAGRLRGDPGAHPRAEGEGDARQAGARAFAVPAGRARFRLRRRPRR